MGFKFDDKNILKLDIAGEEFTLNINQELINKVKEVPEIDSNDLDSTIEGLSNHIESFLGEGSCERIFKGRVKNPLDYIDVLNYIIDEFNKFNEAAAKKLKKYSPDRVKR